MLVAGAGLAVYANALGHPFVFDDAGAIVENGTIRSPGASLAGGPAQMATAGRPVVNVSFALNYLAGDLAPWGYQATNLVIHVACALLLIALFRRLFSLPALARITDGAQLGLATSLAFLWVLHPLTTEIVNYAAQRSEALMAFACLVTLYAGVRALDSSRPAAWQATAVTACALGMGCKESMVVTPLLMLLVDAALTGVGFSLAFRRRQGFYLALFSTWLLLALLIAGAPRGHSAGFATGVSPWVYLLNQATMIVRYLRLAVWPVGLVLDYGEPAAVTLGVVWPAAVFVLALLAATAFLWRRSAALGVFAAWFWLTLAPTSSLVPIATEVGAERRMYVPLIGLLALAVLAAFRGLARLENQQMRTTLARGSLAAIGVVLALLTVGRNREFATPVTIWQTVVERWPNGRGFYNLGVALAASGQQEPAVRAYERALPGSADAQYALGFQLQQEGKYDEALQHYREFIRLRPEDANVPRAYHQIGRTLLAQGKRDDALEAFREVLARKPADPDALAGIADTLLAQEKLSEAVAAYQAYLRVRPNTTDAMMNLGIALVKLDRDGEAREVFRAVTELQPTDVGARVNYAYALANTGRYGDSVREFRKAAEMEKDPKARAEIEAAIAELLGNH